MKRTYKNFEIQITDVNVNVTGSNTYEDIYTIEITNIETEETEYFDYVEEDEVEDIEDLEMHKSYFENNHDEVIEWQNNDNMWDESSPMWNEVKEFIDAK